MLPYAGLFDQSSLAPLPQHNLRVHAAYRFR